MQQHGWMSEILYSEMKLDIKDYILHDSTYMNFRIYSDRKQISDCLGRGVSGMQKA